MHFTTAVAMTWNKDANVKLWMKDFYIGGSDCYSNKSVTMINCSNLYKSQQNNFN